MKHTANIFYMQVIIVVLQWLIDQFNLYLNVSYAGIGIGS